MNLNLNVSWNYVLITCDNFPQYYLTNNISYVQFYVHNCVIHDGVIDNDVSYTPKVYIANISTMITLISLSPLPESLYKLAVASLHTTRIPLAACALEITQKL